MRKPCSALILFVLLVLSLTMAVPAEDVLETTYDESETQPYEAIPLFAILSLSVVGEPSQAPRSAERVRWSTPLWRGVTRVNGEDATRSPNARGALALLCT